MDSDYGDDPNKNLKDYNISTPMHVDSYALLQKNLKITKNQLKN